MLKMRSVFKRSLAAVGCGMLFLASGAQAQITNFTKDVGTSIDLGLAWQDAAGAYTGSAGRATGLSLLALLEKRVDGTDPNSPTQGYALASAADKARMDTAVAWILANIVPQGYFYAYGDGAALMALSKYLLTGGPNPGVQAALNTIFDRVIANQRVGMGDAGAPWPENNGYWCYTDNSCRDSSTTQLVMAGLAAVKGVYISVAYGDGARLALLDAATARARTAYQRNGIPGNMYYEASAGCTISPADEKGHGYNAGSNNTLQQTGSGTWIQLVGGATVNDPDVQKYLHWIRNRYNYDGQRYEPYEGWPSYYYYLWSSSKAYEFIASGAPINPGNIGPSDIGVLAPGAAPVCGTRQVHRDTATDPRIALFGAGGAGYYSVELPRVYYDMAYTLLSYQCANGQYRCNGATSVGDWGYTYDSQAYSLLVLQRSLGGGCIDVNHNGVCDAVEKVCDVNGDGKVDKTDLGLISSSRPQAVLFAGDPRDGNGDGKISPADVAVCMKKCTKPGCAP
jgi:hypothetical protein